MRRIRNLAVLAASAILTASAIVACGPGAAPRSAANGNGDSPDSVPAREAPAVAAEQPPPPQPSPPLVSAPRDTITDAMITGRIRTAILADPAMTGADVSVNTDAGVVVLTGVVKNHEQTGVASAHAQRQDGVMRVDNQLSVDTR